MRKFSDNPNVDNSDLVNYPDARIKDNSGTGDGTPVNERVYGDVVQFFLKLKRLAGLTENNLPDNETNQYQTIEALKEFASKNNYIQNLSSVSGVLTVSAKIGLMQNNESLICKSSVDLGAETQIKGSDNAIIVFANIGAFKTNEYVRLIKTGSTILLVRLVDSVNLDLAISELLYLKKTSQATENTGTSDLFATTPLTNKTVFARRVNGVDSGSYLASISQNGLLSAADKVIIDGITNTIINKGFISGLDVNDTIGALVVSGDISSATASNVAGNASKVVVNMANAMSNTNYIVKMYVQSNSSNIISDVHVSVPIFKPVSTTQFEMCIAQTATENQNIKIHFEVEQL